jgi:phosphatidylserine/phosphatidylglycerophosphate/cardiolipin synthase-like enzyme
VDRRLISGSAERCYQHAKVVIADASTSDAKALVTSANFSETAQRHNFEAGWLTKSAPRVQEICKQFSLVVEQGLFLPLENNS